jgi:LmbE family N-acetylglucosaminyl deacetylase
MKNEHIVVFAAHPDDEGSAWATLFKYYEHGAKISIIWMTNGDKFIAPIGKYSRLLSLYIKSVFSKQINIKISKKIAQIRKTEALGAAELIDADAYFLGFKDTNVPPYFDKAAIFKIVELIRKIKPTIILTHYYNETHKDHQNTSAMLTRAFIHSSSKNYKTDSPPHKVRSLAFWDERGKNFKPNLYINVKNQISPVNRVKEWGKLYKSQAFRIVGRFAKYKYRFYAIKTPYYFVERFKVYGIKFKYKFLEFFP